MRKFLILLLAVMLVLVTGCAKDVPKETELTGETLEATLVDELISMEEEPIEAETTEAVTEESTETESSRFDMFPLEDNSSSFVWKFGDDTKYVNTVVTFKFNSYKDLTLEELNNLFPEESTFDEDLFQPRVYNVTITYKVGDYTVPVSEWPSYIRLPLLRSIETYPGGFGLRTFDIFYITGSVANDVSRAVKSAIEEGSTTITATGNIHVFQPILEKDSILTFSYNYMDTDWYSVPLPPIN